MHSQIQHLSQLPSCHLVSHLAKPCDPGLKTLVFMKNTKCGGVSFVAETWQSAENWRNRYLNRCWQIWSVHLKLLRTEGFCIFTLKKCLIYKGIKWTWKIKGDFVLKVRERREKTRLRVARWRAKRKLQACLNQMQVGDSTTVSALRHFFWKWSVSFSWMRSPSLRA